MEESFRVVGMDVKVDGVTTMEVPANKSNKTGEQSFGQVKGGRGGFQTPFRLERCC